MTSTRATRNILRRAGAIAATGIAVFGLLMTAGAAMAQQPKIKIGLMLPYTGTYAALGTTITNGFKFAIDEQGGKLGGREIEYFAVDDESDPAKAPDNANKLIKRDRVDVLVGTVHSGVALAMAKLAAQSRSPRAWHLFSDAAADGPTRAAADRALGAAGLAGRRGHIAAALSHGEQRQLEIAMVLATHPEVLLLDEPLAGMGTEETARMVPMLKTLARDHAILLVEHDMDAVFAVADVITVMFDGQVLESRAPEQIHASPAVRVAYLVELR
jgi:hypothetical protein